MPRVITVVNNSISRGVGAVYHPWVLGGERILPSFPRSVVFWAAWCVVVVVVVIVVLFGEGSDSFSSLLFSWTVRWMVLYYPHKLLWFRDVRTPALQTHHFPRSVSWCHYDCI